MGSVRGLSRQHDHHGGFVGWLQFTQTEVGFGP
jgi:hypothetical protein